MGDQQNQGNVPFAHLRGDLPRERWQTLAEHLEGTAEFAARFGRAFHAEELCRQCALLHDAGKASNAFQERLTGGGEIVRGVPMDSSQGFPEKPRHYTRAPVPCPSSEGEGRGLRKAHFGVAADGRGGHAERTIPLHGIRGYHQEALPNG